MSVQIKVQIQKNSKNLMCTWSRLCFMRIIVPHALGWDFFSNNRIGHYNIYQFNHHSSPNHHVEEGGTKLIWIVILPQWLCTLYYFSKISNFHPWHNIFLTHSLSPLFPFPWEIFNNHKSYVTTWTIFLLTKVTEASPIYERENRFKTQWLKILSL